MLNYLESECYIISESYYIAFHINYAILKQFLYLISFDKKHILKQFYYNNYTKFFLTLFYFIN